MADEHVHLLDSNLATKIDLAAVKKDLAAVNKDLQVKMQTVKKDLRVEIQAVRADLLKWMVTAMIAQAGLIVALIRLL